MPQNEPMGAFWYYRLHNANRVWDSITWLYMWKLIIAAGSSEKKLIFLSPINHHKKDRVLKRALDIYSNLEVYSNFYLFA